VINDSAFDDPLGVCMKNLALFLFLVLFVQVAPAVESHSSGIAIVGVNVVPMDTQRVLENQTVIVADDRIVGIGGSDRMVVPDGATRIDGKGRYLMPGLADLHVHVRRSDEYVNHLAHGVTTIMHLGGSESRGRKLLEDRRRIAAGDLIGPNIYATERIFDGDPPAAGSAYRISSPDDARERVVALKQAGFDFIKIYNNVSLPVFQAIVAEARLQNLPVFGHVPRGFDALTALRQGQNAVVHSEEFFFTYFKGPRQLKDMDRSYRPDLSKVAVLVNTLAENDVAVMPDLSYVFTNFLMWDGLDHIWNDAELQFQHPNTIADWKRSSINRRNPIDNFVVRGQWKYQLMQELTRQFQQAGVLQVIGTDAALAGLYPGKAAHRELTELVKAGLSNYQALSAGTRNAGEFINKYIDDSVLFGRIEPGYRADLIMIEENPLDDIRHARDVVAVMVSGRWIERSELDQRRNELAHRYQVLNTINEETDLALKGPDPRPAIQQLLESNNHQPEFEKAIERRINSAGYALAGNQELSRARVILRLATQLFPQSPNAWDSLAEICLQGGDRNAAIEYYKKALKVDPEFSNAARQLERIQQEKG
jgi:tetratricopeptide (TPR) repeat protein